MPTVLRHKGFRFFFYTNEHLPIHIHIEKIKQNSKIQLGTFFLELVYSRKFKASEISEMQKIVSDNQEYLIHQWNEYFGNT